MTSGWPPPLGKSLADFGGDWEAFKAHAYSVYYEGFYANPPVWPVSGVRFNLKRFPEFEGRCKTFWHLISEGSDESNRRPVDDRCQRIAWARILLEDFCSCYPNGVTASVVWWKNTRRGSNRILIAPPDFSYVVVLDDRGSYILFWTAYPVEHSNRRRRLREEYESYWR